MATLAPILRALRSQPEGTEVRLGKGLLVRFICLAPETLEIRREQGSPAEREIRTVATTAWSPTANWLTETIPNGVRLTRRYLAPRIPPQGSTAC